MTHALPLLLALAFASDPAAAPPDAEAVGAIDFAGLTPAEAARLEGKRALYRVNVAGEEAAAVFEIDAPGDVTGVLIIHADLGTGPRTVEAVLHMDYFRARVGKDGTPFPAAWVYRLEKAAVVGRLKA
jgi:hypothetical protein